MTTGTVGAPFHRRYLTLVEEIEQGFDVAHWRSGDVDIWPMARMDLYLDMAQASGGHASPAQPSFARRAVGGLASPLTNLWRSRRDLSHWAPWPRRAHAVILGDGVSLDRVAGAWRDRFAEPVIAALEARGHAAFLMQTGGPNRLPWRRKTFATNAISAWSALAGELAATPADLPDHLAVMAFLAGNGVDAPSLSATRLVRRARGASAAARAFEGVLRSVRPRMAFVVTWYAGLGHAFVLACRRQGVLSVDLQHCPQDAAHKAYAWRNPPASGYSTLPALFWTWSQADAAHIRDWTRTLAAPWHDSLHGGHAQLAAFLDSDDPGTKTLDAEFAAIGDRGRYAREILVALQPIGGREAVWDALARQVEQAPTNWRWWIRRHPASSAGQDAVFGRLLQLRQANVIIEPASSLPLPALLRHMSGVVSLASGAAAEAAAFGVPAFFLSAEAEETFGGLISRGQARVVDVQALIAEIDRTPAVPTRPTSEPSPDIGATLERLETLANNYARLYRSTRT